MGKKKTTKTSTAKSSVPVSVDNAAPIMTQDEMESMVRKRLIEVELSSSRLDTDMKGLQFDEELSDKYVKENVMKSKFYIDMTADAKTLSELACDVDDSVRNEIGTKLKSAFASRLNELKAIQDENTLLYDECVAATNDKHDVINKINNARRETLKQKELSEKLKEMCRMLQQSVKSRVEERNKLIHEDKTRWNHVVLKFKDTMKDINEKLTVEEGQQEKQQEENNNLKAKMDQFNSQAETRDDHIEAQITLKTNEIEKILGEIPELDKQLETEMHRSKTYKDTLLQLVMNDTELKSQIAAYSEKFQSFQDGLLKGQSTFKQFEERSALMQKLISKTNGEKLLIEKNILESELIVTKHHALIKEVEELSIRKKEKELECRELQLELKELADVNNMAIPKVETVTSNPVTASGESKNADSVSPPAATPPLNQSIPLSDSQDVDDGDALDESSSSSSSRCRSAKPALCSTVGDDEN